MGNDEDPADREYKYRELYNGIYCIENDILQDLLVIDYNKKRYKTFGLINKGLCKKYPYLLKNSFDYKETLNYNFNNKDIPHSYQDKFFTYINKTFSFTFPNNFIFINEDFISVIQTYMNEKKIKENIKSKFDTIIGGGCLIMKNPYDKSSINPFRFIILYNEIKDKEGNEIYFFLYIKDKKPREDIVIYILKYGLLNFFSKINYSFTDEYKKFNEGYIVRSCSEDRIKYYLAKLESKKAFPPPSLKIINNIEKYPQTSFPKKRKIITSDSFINAILLGLFK